MAVTTVPATSAFERPSGTFPRLSPMRAENPALQAVINKLVTNPDRSSGHRAGPMNVVQPLDTTLLGEISGITGTNVQDASSLFQLLPDTELAMQILVSSILSPKDLVTTEITYKVDASQFNSPVAGAFLDTVRDYFENTYKIKEINPQILQDCLFFTGSYPLLILPENTIDDIINSNRGISNESLSEAITPQGTMRPLGFLGSNVSVEKRDTSASISFEDRMGFHPAPVGDDRISVEKLGEGLANYLRITDNFNILKLPYLRERVRVQRTEELLARQSHTTGLETFPKPGDERTESLYRERQWNPRAILAVKPQDGLRRPPVGHPLVMKLPSECVVPVHMPSNPETHLGYFVLLDQNGHPLTRALESDYYTDLSTNLNSHNDQVSQLIATTRRMEMGRETSRSHTTQELQRVFDELVEQDFLARLHNGAYGDNVEISQPQDLYRIMLARALKKMVTQVLYVPKELMTYMAFDYNRYGVGTSLIQNSKIIGGIRAMLLFANTMAAIKNSVGREQLNIQLSEKDPQPTKTVQFLIHEYAKTRQASYPLGASNPIDIISFLQNAGVQVAVTGNTGFPETKFDIEDKQSNHTRIDTELETTLRDRWLMSLGLSPETVVAGANAEFATTIVTQNLLLTKRVLVYQNQLTAFLKDFVQKYVRNSGTLMEELRQAGKDFLKESDEKKDAKEAPGPETEPQESAFRSFDENETAEDPEINRLILEFLNSLELSLPAPDTATMDNQMKAFDEYSEALDKTLDAYINTSFLTQTGMGEMEGLVDEVKAAVKAMYLRQWMRSNNVLPELEDLVMTDDEGKPEINLLELESIHTEAMGNTLLSYAKAVLRAKSRTDDKYKALAEKFGVDEASSSGGFDEGSDESDEGSEGGEEGGDSEDGGDLDLDTAFDESDTEGDKAAEGEGETEEPKKEGSEEGTKDEPSDENEVKEESADQISKWSPDAEEDKDKEDEDEEES